MTDIGTMNVAPVRVKNNPPIGLFPDVAEGKRRYVPRPLPFTWRNALWLSRALPWVWEESIEVMPRDLAAFRRRGRSSSSASSIDMP